MTEDIGQQNQLTPSICGWGCLDIFTLIYLFSPLSPSLWETARYRLKYCFKGPLNLKQPTNQMSAQKLTLFTATSRYIYLTNLTFSNTVNRLDYGCKTVVPDLHFDTVDLCQCRRSRLLYRISYLYLILLMVVG